MSIELIYVTRNVKCKYQCMYINCNFSQLRIKFIKLDVQVTGGSSAVPTKFSLN